MRHCLAHQNLLHLHQTPVMVYQICKVCPSSNLCFEICYWSRSTATGSTGLCLCICTLCLCNECNVCVVFPASAFVLYIWLEEKYDTETLIYIRLSSNVPVVPDVFLNIKFKLHVIPYTVTATVLVSQAHTVCTAYLIALW